jgi:type IV pilus assembly protein PilO
MKFGLRELIFFLVLLAVPVASFMYVFKPRNEDIKHAREEVEVKQANLDKLAAVQEKIDDLGLEIERGQEAIELIEDKLPTLKEVDVILAEVEKLAQANRLNIKSVKSKKAVPAADYMEQPLSMKLTGRFDGFYEFMLQLENLPRITRIHQMKLSRSNKGIGPNRQDVPPGAMTAEFTLSIYFQPH